MNVLLCPFRHQTHADRHFSEHMAEMTNQVNQLKPTEWLSFYKFRTLDSYSLATCPIKALKEKDAALFPWSHNSLLSSYQVMWQ